MTLRIIDEEPEVAVTREELNRYQQEYQRDFMFYSGPVPTLEQYIRQRRGSVPQATTTLTVSEVQK